ncbi:MAG TPA: hypothetical protein VGG28_11505 [Kofleriaceae bacterium]|jgi:uncharacterized protein YbjT (DUF2867 family)
MNVVIFGASGMVGQGVMRECLLDAGVGDVLSVVRTPSSKTDPKLRELVHADFTDFTGVDFGTPDACFWCLGVTSAGLDEAAYTKITHDYTIAAARVLAKPTCTMIFVSGTGADGNAMWARVKRRTEDDLTEMTWKHIFVFRPGMIRPLHGIRSRTRMYNVLYPLLWPIMQVARVIAPNSVTSTERVGRAMLHVARDGYRTRVLSNRDINEAAT